MSAASDVKAALERADAELFLVAMAARHLEPAQRDAVLADVLALRNATRETAIRVAPAETVPRDIGSPLLVPRLAYAHPPGYTRGQVVRLEPDDGE